MKPKISAFIITKNEERNIRRALESVKWADEIVVLDSFSTDKTCKIAKEYTKRVYQSKFKSFDTQKNKAIKLCRYDWILEMDADEEFSADAEREIRSKLSSDDSKNYEAFSMLREDGFLNHAMTSSWKTRLYRNNNYFYEGYIHEKINIKGKVGKLKTRIHHYNNQTVSEWWEYAGELSSHEADKMLFVEKKKYNTFQIATIGAYRSIKTFFTYYFYLGLVFKGFVGLEFSTVASFYELLTMLKYYEKKYITNKKKQE